MNIIGNEQVVSSGKIGMEVGSGNQDGIREKEGRVRAPGRYKGVRHNVSMRSTSKPQNGLQLQRTIISTPL